MATKILMISWAWRATGGDWTYIENLNRLYTTNGYEVIPFSIKNENNFTSKYDYFIDGQDYRSLNKKKNISNGLKAFKNAIVSKKALQMLEVILNEHEISVAHLHNIHHHLTPAIIYLLKKRNVRIIWTLHDYKIICPENSFVSNGIVCEKCINGSFINCTTNKCKKDSLSASFLATIEAYYYRKSNAYNFVDAYLCPSIFLKTKFQQAGFQLSKLKITNYCYDVQKIDDFVKDNLITCILPQKYILYVGRIETIKGVKTLIEAVAGTDVLLKIVGDGAALECMKSYSESLAAHNIQFLGFQDKLSVFHLLQQASFVICPSEWYENYPFAVIESLLFSKPVVGANIGGIPELVIHNKTGLLFEPGNAIDLKEKILLLWENNTLQLILGRNARLYTEQLVCFESHWRLLKPFLFGDRVELVPQNIL